MTDPFSKSSTHVMSTDSEHFDRDVFEASRQTPIVVDFWAPWCAPCRLLTPVMENLAATYEGRFILVKANTDEVSEAAGRFNVQGIPAVFAVVDGEIVEMFTGALPEDDIRRWLDRVLVTRSLAQARRLEASSPAAAEATYRELMANSPQEAAPRIGLARTLQAQERWDDCEEVIAALEQRGFLEPEAEAVKSALELRRMRRDDLDELRRTTAAEPNNGPLQLQFAEALAGAQHYEEALQMCLTLVQWDREELGEKARLLMLDIFRVLPADSELTREYRRKLSRALYY